MKRLKKPITRRANVRRGVVGTDVDLFGLQRKGLEAYSRSYSYWGELGGTREDARVWASWDEQKIGTRFRYDKGIHQLAFSVKSNRVIKESSQP